MQIPPKVRLLSLAPDLLIMAVSGERAQFYDGLVGPISTSFWVDVAKRKLYISSARTPIPSVGVIYIRGILGRSNATYSVASRNFVPGPTSGYSRIESSGVTQNRPMRVT